MDGHFLTYPQIDPVLFSIGPISLRWYGLMYLVGFVFARFLAAHRAKKPNSNWTVEQVDNLLFAGLI